jgi:hypothetical protein
VALLTVTVVHGCSSAVVVVLVQAAMERTRLVTKLVATVVLVSLCGAVRTQVVVAVAVAAKARQRPVAAAVVQVEAF